MTQKRVKASDVIGNSYYIYTLESSNNTPALNGTINITCNVTNVYGQAVSGKSITLYQNNTSKGAKTTDSNGNTSWNSISMSSAGLQVFKVENSKIEVFVDNKSDIGHTHSQYLTEHQSLSNYVTTDDSRLSDSRTPTSHTHGNLQNNGQVGSTAQANKNVVTNSSGLITTEDKPTIPSASSTTPSADTENGSVGTGTTWARSNHAHPKSSLYAESSHSHTKLQITDFPTIPSKTSDLTNDSGFLTSHQDISGKLDKTQTSYKGKNVVVDSSSGNITFEEKNNHTHSNYLTSTDISGKIDTAGTGLSKSGTTLNHSNSVAALTTASFKKVKYDSQGHITGTSDVSASDLPSHNHTKSQITDFPTIPSKTSDLTNDSGFLTFEDGAIYIEGTNATTETTTNTFKGTTSKLSHTNLPDGTKIIYKVSVTSTNNTNDLRLQLSIGGIVETYIKINNKFTTANLYPQNTLLFLVRWNGVWNIVGTSTLENSNNKVSSWSSTPTDINYPSEKLVKDSLDSKIDTNLTYATATGNNDEILCRTYDDGKIHRTQAIKSNWIKNPIALTGTGGIGSASGDGQSSINTKINNALVNLTANKEDKIYRIVGTEVSSPSSSSARLHCGTLPFDNISGKIFVYVVPDISSLSASQKALIYGTYPSGSNISYNIFKSNNEYLTIGDIQTGDELLLMDEGDVRVISNSSISNKENKSNKVTSWSSTTTDIHYPSEKLVKDSLDLKSDSIHTHTIDLNSFDFYDADNWRTLEGNAPIISSNSIQANAVSSHILNKEFLESKYYTLTFEFNTASSRNGLYLFGDMECNRKFGIVTDVGNTFVEQYDSNGNATRLYDGTKNHFTSGWHDIKVIRKGATATLYIDDELYYTFTNIGSCTNILGLWKWSANSVTIRNVDVSLDVTELPVDDYVGSDDILDLVYPVGSIYMSVNSTSPATLFGGTWEQIKDMFLLASGDTYSNGATGGSADATLVSHQHGTPNSGEYFVTSESDGANNTKVAYSSSGSRYVDGMTDNTTPFHHRVGTGYVGSSGTGKNMPPYLAVNVWKRIG